MKQGCYCQGIHSCAYYPPGAGDARCAAIDIDRPIQSSHGEDVAHHKLMGRLRRLFINATSNMKMLRTTPIILARHHSPCQKAGAFGTTSALPDRVGLLLLALTALGTAHAQIFVSNYSGNSIGKYDAYTGAAIDASLVTSGVSQPLGIAVSNSTLYVALHASGTINSYTLAGATISVPFLTMSPSATYQPVSLMLSGTTLYVGGNNGVLSTYNIANNGATINASLFSPTFAKVGLALSGSTLYISNPDAGTIGTYNTDTGAAMNAAFKTGLPINSAYDIALFGSTLFVTDAVNGNIRAYDAITGALNSATFITGLSVPYGLVVTGSTLFVSEKTGNRIGAYDAATGVAINASFITGLNGPTYFAVLGGAIPEPSTYATLAGLAALGIGAFRKSRRRNSAFPSRM